MPPTLLPRDAQSCAPESTAGPDGSPPALSRADAERAALLLKAVADPVRLQLLSLIRASPSGEACVCHLTGPVGLSQPTVSHHLKVLVAAGLLEREKRGGWAWVRVIPDRLTDIAAIFQAA